MGILCDRLRAGVSGVTFGFWTVLLASLAAGPFAYISAAAEEPQSYSDFVAGFEKTEGLFTFYRDPDDGTLFMAFTAAQLAEGAEFIYHAHMVNSVAGMPLPPLGTYRRPHIMSFRRHYDRVEFRKENTAFHFDPASPLTRASDANIQPAIVGFGRIVSRDEDKGLFLVKVDDLFRSEMLQQIVPAGMFTLSLNPMVTKIEAVRSYARNAQVVVAYAYDSDGMFSSRDIPDGRALTATLQHSFVALPKPGFKDRRDDYRVGYFTNRITDLTSQSLTPWADVIQRWRLEKKDPEAELSEPVKPITFWIQNTTPLEYRATIIEAGLGWNAAFEKAGFRNAVEIKVQSDDATWDANDVDYNVLRWVSTPSLPYYGYGPRLADPRTGEIIAADIMLEHRTLRGMGLALGALSAGEPTGNVAAMLAKYAEDRPLERGFERCELDGLLASMALLPDGLKAADDSEGSPGIDAGQKALTAFDRQILHFLITHEMGHTLGLAHNFISSTWVNYDTINSETYEAAGVLSGSIMDYPELNVAASDEKQGLYFPMKPGPYDLWAIEFGYTPAKDDPAEEAAARKALLDRSTEPGLAYSISSTDPRVAVWDMSDDPISFAIDRMSLIRKRLQIIRSEMIIAGGNRDGLWAATSSLLAQKNRQAYLLASYIGGVYEEHADVGQPGSTTPYRPVSLVDQKRAMAALSQHFMAPDAWDLPDDLVADLQHRRRGFEAPFISLTSTIRGRQAAILADLLNPGTTGRMAEAHNHGGAYMVEDMLDDLTRAVFDEDQTGVVNTNRRNLQTNYVDALTFMALSGVYASDAEAHALQALTGIEKMMARRRGSDEATRAHQSHLSHKIRTTVYGVPSKPKSANAGWLWFRSAWGEAQGIMERSALAVTLTLMSWIAD